MRDEIEKIGQIVKKKLAFYGTEESRRLLHGRGNTYENLLFLNIDLFPPSLFITLYEPRQTNWNEEILIICDQISEVDSVVVQRRDKTPWKNEIIKGKLPEEHIVDEVGLKYSVSLEKGENPGLFLDMRDGRSYVREISKSKKVLNLFSYSCAFSVAAIAGGAKSVLNIDMNSNSLNKGRFNHTLNDQNEKNISYLSHNILKSFGKIIRKGPFDLVIIDPPPSQGNSFNLERDYGKILRKSKEFLSDKGEILCCLNSHSYDFEWFKMFIADNLGHCTILKELGASSDFPELYREKGLKIIHIKA